MKIYSVTGIAWRIKNEEHTNTEAALWEFLRQKRAAKLLSALFDLLIVFWQIDVDQYDKMIKYKQNTKGILARRAFQRNFEKPAPYLAHQRTDNLVDVVKLILTPLSRSDCPGHIRDAGLGLIPLFGRIDLSQAPTEFTSLFYILLIRFQAKFGSPMPAAVPEVQTNLVEEEEESNFFKLCQKAEDEALFEFDARESLSATMDFDDLFPKHIVDETIREYSSGLDDEILIPVLPKELYLGESFQHTLNRMKVELLTTEIPQTKSMYEELKSLGAILEHKIALLTANLNLKSDTLSEKIEKISQESATKNWVEEKVNLLSLKIDSASAFMRSFKKDNEAHVKVLKIVTNVRKELEDLVSREEYETPVTAKAETFKLDLNLSQNYSDLLDRVRNKFDFDFKRFDPVLQEAKDILVQLSNVNKSLRKHVPKFIHPQTDVHTPQYKVIAQDSSNTVKHEQSPINPSLPSPIFPIPASSTPQSFQVPICDDNSDHRYSDLEWRSIKLQRIYEFRKRLQLSGPMTNGWVFSNSMSA